MITFAAVDGTSSEPGEEHDPGKYQETFRNSFCRQLYLNKWVNFSNPFYERGPFTSGRSTAARARKAFNHVVRQWESGEAKAIFLAGYSRGGAAAIEIAKWLKYEKNIPVECLILFDPVDRTHTLGSIFANTPIPSTVKTCIYAQRNKNTTLSRISFGNCGWKKEDPGMDYRYQKFFATHGGVGGTPWTKAINPYLPGEIPHPFIWEFGEVNSTTVTVSRDKIGRDMVRAWVLPQVVSSYMICKSRLANESAPGNGKGKDARKPANVLAVHKVVSGDSLSKLAIKYYGQKNMMKYPVIHQANYDTIGPNENLIHVGQVLTIPKLTT